MQMYVICIKHTHATYVKHKHCKHDKPMNDQEQNTINRATMIDTQAFILSLKSTVFLSVLLQF